jgi:hypothetical protein
MLMKKPEHAVAGARGGERAEARFYYVVLFPVCLAASIISCIGRPASIWSEARRQANTIVPFIMMR